MSESAEFSLDTTQDLPTIPTDQTEQLPVLPKKHTRREVVAAGVAGAAGLVLGGIALKSARDSDNSTEHRPLAALSIPEQQTQTQEAQATVEHLPEISSLEKVNVLAQMEVFSYERNVEEINFAESATTLEDIDLGLQVCADMGARIRLLEKRSQLREIGTEGMVQLSDIQKQFCEENDITYEVLGMCLDSYGDAKNIITRLQPKLREDEQGKLVDPEMLMINAGGMAKLIMEETSGFINIGQARAVTQLFKFNEETQQDEIDTHNIENLRKICELINQNTGLQLNYQNIPGSERGNVEMNSSGGAIGIQFMPDRALEYYYKIITEGGFDPKKEGNIFDPLQSIKMAWTFIACHERVAPGPDGFRWGYLRGNPEAIEYAIRKWNDLDSEVNAIKNAAHDYYDDVISNQMP